MCKEAALHQTTMSFYVNPLPEAANLKEAQAEAAQDRKDLVALAQSHDWVKLAASLPPMTKVATSLPSYAGPNSVDAILSLNFVNDANLEVFVDAIPSLVSARRTLAELYVSRTLGLEDIDLSAIVSGMDHLHKVIQGLNKARMRLSI